jgi:hypothetical protein
MVQTTPEVVGRFECNSDYLAIVGEVTRTSAGLVMSRVEVSTDLPSGLTHKLLREVPLGEILAQARARVELADRAANQPIRIPPQRHATMTDEVLRDVARVYIKECASGGRGVIGRMQERFGRPQGTIITWVSRARRDGWLGPGVKGRLGAEPGPKLLAWIDKLQNCETCHGKPPAGFACQTCGADGQPLGSES